VRRGAAGVGWLLALAALVLVAVLAAHRAQPGSTPMAGRCTVAGSDLTLTTAQAANAATIAAVARSRGLPARATVIALATAQQESRLRNLDYGDRDSLGLFQQRPSQGWGTEAQVQDPVYSAGQFFDGLVEVPGWETGRLTEVAQRVQRSGFPEAYQQWEPMATSLGTALLSDSPAQLSCTFSPVDATGPLDERAAAVADVVRREAGAPTVLPGGVLSVAGAGWPEASWAVAHAERLQLAGVAFADWAWSPGGGWTQTGQDAGGLRLQLAT
jgi:archaellin